MLNKREPSGDIELLDIKRALAALDVELKLCRLGYLLRKYSPGQPRVPAGSPAAGQWTRVGGGGGGADDSAAADGNGLDADARVLIAQGDTSYDIDLNEQGRLGGHAISLHVGISEDILVARVVERGQGITARGNWFTGLSEGSFTSLDSATNLVNATLAANRDAVETVARGEARDAFVEASFGSRTGYEAYLPDPNSTLYIRETNAVSVYIRRDPRAPNGFRVQSAFPMNW
jgi:hypothetical protein